MTSPSIDFRKIRPHHGSQDHGFEELCCQVVSLESRPASAVFYRKGLGADAGVECLVKYEDGSETGWQAKWFSTLGASQISQLDKSIKQALAKHWKLKRYIVCLPFNLRDARTGKSQSEQQRWDAWVKKWKDYARKDHRSISIDLWDATLLIQRLTRNDPLHAGRLSYWFDQTTFDSFWFKQRFAAAKASLGERYTPETNVDLPIRRTLLAFGRDPVVQTEIETWLNRLEEARYRAIDALDRRFSEEKTTQIRRLDDATGHLARSLLSTSGEPDAVLPLQEWGNDALCALEASYPCVKALWEREAQGTKEQGENTRYAVHCLNQLDGLLRDFCYALRDERWRIVNARRLLVFGDAGVGKSHLFGDATEHWIESKCPAILILGSSFVDAEPWSQILDQLGLRTLDRDTFLGALDAAAQAAGTRAVIFIDAINERNGLEVWQARLAAFLQAIEGFPRVAIVLSCRTSYLPFVIDDSTNEDHLPRIQHIGFAGRAGEAAQIYLDRRGIVRMAAPNFTPEFENPLFLKTCCDFLEKEGLREFPRGLRGVTKIFEFYFTAVTHQIEKRLKLDPLQKITAQAISALADAADQSERGYIGKDTAIKALEPIFPSHGMLERSLLGQFVSEGLLSMEPVRLPDGSSEELVRFTFERYSDHRIAARLLDSHLDTNDPSDSFAKGSPLHAYVMGKGAYRKMGVIEAIAIQLPERCEAELPDVIPPEKYTPPLLQTAFIRSVLWRDQRCFRKRTIDLLEELSKGGERDELLRTLVAVATEPDNQFNAGYLDSKLSRLAMPARDQWWSTFIANDGDSDDSPIQTLISWISHNGLLQMEEKRAELAAILLSWMFSTSHRVIRDKATKALSTLVAVRLPLAVKLVRRFSSVDDFYIVDRVFAAAYGGALQGMQTQALGELAVAAFESVFAANKPVAHILIRDHARGIIELAHSSGVLSPRIDMSRARPPYRSSWPLKDVPKGTIERYVEKYPSGTFRDEIVGSCINDGDFARYEIDSAVRHWSSLPISAARKTQEDIFEEWKKKALRTKPKANAALAKVIAAYNSVRHEQKETGSHFLVLLRFIDGKGKRERPTGNTEGSNSKEERAWKKKEKELRRLEDALRSTLGERLWAEYCEYARAYVHREVHNLSTRYDWPPRLDSNLVRRWVCKRAHDLGWTPKRFSQFDRNVRSAGRHGHRIERIGKKYQWIALHELLAHLGDNVAFVTGNRDELEVFDGPWQISARDIDPSLLATQSFDEGWRQWEPTWWMPAKTNLTSVSPEERLLWLDSEEDFWNDPSMIAVTEPKSGDDWFVIDEFVTWHQWGRNRGEKTLERSAFCNISCLVVHKGDRQKLIDALSGRILSSSHDLTNIEIPYGGYIGEYCWHPMYGRENGWAASDLWNKIPVPTQPMEASYSAKQTEFDYSIEDSFTFKVPCPGLVRGVGLRLSDGQSISFTDALGRRAFFDPSTKEPGPSAAAIRQSTFLEYLSREDLDAVWVMTSRKEVFGGKKHDGGWGGERAKCSLFWLTTGGFARRDHDQHERPTGEQLRKFWETQEPREL